MVTKEDLTRYTDAIERSSARVHEVLKEVAVQLSDTAKQLELLARQLEDGRRDNISAHKDIDTSLVVHEKDCATRASVLSRVVEQNSDEISKLDEVVSGQAAVTASIVSSRDLTLASQQKTTMAVQEAQAATKIALSTVEMAIIRSRTLILIICGVMTTIMTLVVTLLKR